MQLQDFHSLVTLAALLSCIRVALCRDDHTGLPGHGDPAPPAQHAAPPPPAAHGLPIAAAQHPALQAFPANPAVGAHGGAQGHQQQQPRAAAAAQPPGTSPAANTRSRTSFLPGGAHGSAGPSQPRALRADSSSPSPSPERRGSAPASGASSRRGTGSSSPGAASRPHRRMVPLPVPEHLRGQGIEQFQEEGRDHYRTEVYHGPELHMAPAGPDGVRRQAVRGVFTRVVSHTRPEVERTHGGRRVTVRMEPGSGGASHLVDQAGTQVMVLAGHGRGIHEMQRYGSGRMVTEVHLTGRRLV